MKVAAFAFAGHGRAGLVLAGLALAAGTPAHADTPQTILSANFDGEPLDQTIGTGGAAVGEPVYVGAVGGAVRAAPFATPSVEIDDELDLSGDSMRFDFLNDVEIVSGTVTLSANLWFEELGNYSVLLEPVGSASRTFTWILFQDDGTIAYFDYDTPSPVTIGAYAAGASFPLVITQYLDSGTYDVTWNGTPLLQGETHGITDRGLGSIIFGSSPDPDTAGVYYVDDVLVTATVVPSPVEPQGWGSLKAKYR
jgi:hypothetical protein